MPKDPIQSSEKDKTDETRPQPKQKQVANKDDRRSNSSWDDNALRASDDKVAKQVLSNADCACDMEDRVVGNLELIYWQVSQWVTQAQQAL